MTPEWWEWLPDPAEPWLSVAGQLLIVALASIVVFASADAVIRRLTAPHRVPGMVWKRTRTALRWAFVLLTLQAVLRSAPDALTGMVLIRHFVSLMLIAAMTRAAISAVGAVSRAVMESNPADHPDNLRSRRILTQAQVLSRSLQGLILFIGFSAALTTFPSVRQFGAGLLASAGVAGLVVGLAAKPVLGNLLAGLQLAFTQPIRLDDVVIVEGEWGWIEEITGTYVVVRLWDQRRLIVPLQWFIEHPFQNWTRKSADIVGSVFVWVDFRTPLEPLRREAERICRGAPEWDGRVCNVQVTESGERSMQVRILVSAADSPRCWDLRCRVREGLVLFLQREYPDCLPRLRADAMLNRSLDSTASA